ncbi:MAG: NitT/TauT family transport system substrate-binding protein [Candidatus Electronema aureum]|uniref:NitT/TauT family transport system substrate-binding protein n=1 Tax=Candidatus Electronema aureum TaxID=2005002 RepID=A0A521G3F7_9BACT|nr:MAG: NitT/TauT family transport system substrate-binding protein [Candidatus Electronema aureum]
MQSDLKLSKGWQLAAGVGGWLVLITVLHLWLNFDYGEKKVFTMGYMPVITNMSAPLLDHVSKDSSDVYFKALKFSSFAEMASALRSDKIQAAFIIAPLSVVLRQQGVDVKVVYIGNRHESTLVAKKGLNVRSFEDLGGKTVAVPIRYSGHNLSLLELMEQKGMQGRVNIVELNPPDMASALAAGSLDAYYVGEPFAARSLKGGSADLVLHVEDVWPNFICNLVIVKQNTIAQDPKMVQKFVQGAARASLWAKTHQEQAADIAAEYWSQSSDVAKYALSSRKVVFDHFTPKTEEMKQIADLMVKHRLIADNKIDGLVDDQFAAAVNIEDIQELKDILE